ncbi:MAG TPA: DUF5683 domain-containing protein [Longimicrobiales bacterium]|nr:DUF5683 domain-containing protein [Longimicrobiales bacterium]
MLQRTLFSAVFAATLIAAASVAPAAAQNVPAVPGDSMPVADSIPPEAPLPRGAFIRALAVPGWGHMYIDEPRRAAVYFTLQATSIGMLVKSLSDLGRVRDVYGPLDRAARDSLDMLMAEDTVLAKQLENPDAYDRARLEYPGLNDARLLVRAREEHRQDWIVYTLFFTFAAAVDAYVTAHMKDFPAEFSAVPQLDGTVRLAMRVPMPRF